MIVRMGWLQKPQDWSLERFREHWRGHHGDLARQLPGLRAYVQNHIVDHVQRGIAFQRGPMTLDGFSQLWFDDLAAMQAAIASPVGPQLVADEQVFIGDLRITAVDSYTVIAPPKEGALKRMSILRRKIGMSSEQFADEWRRVHAPLVRQLPGILGYRQNRILSRAWPKGHGVSHEVWPVDGVVELWFADTAALDAAFASPAGQAAMAHANTFIEEITTFWVEPFVVVDREGELR